MAKTFFMKNSSRVQMMGIVIITDKGNTIVIDGGMEEDHEHLYELISKEGNGRVKAWFFTHLHCDHTGAFCKLCSVNSKLEVENIYYHFPSLQDHDKYGSKSDRDKRIRTETVSLINNRFGNAAHVMQEREKYVFDDLTFTVLRVYNPTIKANLENNSSAVIRIDGKKSNILILGDLGVEGGDDTLSKCTFEDLHTEYTQLAHHGQQAVKRDFYEFIRPVRCLWFAPDWLWDNDEGNGFNTGPYETVMTREWMKDLGVTKHIISKDGTTVFEI